MFPVPQRPEQDRSDSENPCRDIAGTTDALDSSVPLRRGLKGYAAIKISGGGK